MPIISVPKPLREKLGDEGSDALIELMNRQTESERDNIIEIVEEKFGRRLTGEMTKVNERISQESAWLEVLISNGHANLIKWMFIFWLGQVSVIVAILFAFFR